MVFQLGAEAVDPDQSRERQAMSARLAVLDFFLDDIFPDLLARKAALRAVAKPAATAGLTEERSPCNVS